MSAVTGYEQGAKLPDFARQHPNGGYYLPHNSALLYRNGAEPLVYHKSKLVVGVEKMPYPKVMGLLDAFALNLGGMSGTLGTQTERAVFQHAGIAAAPVICYESIFGGFVTSYIRDGANLIAIITNDGWWGDTDGYRQHMAFARLRAIENRRDVARSANTGISGFINQRGDIVGQTGWWEQTTLTAQVHLNEELSFYTRYGDYIPRTAAFLAVLIYLISLARSRTKKSLRP
jgi:apolipoprotein N-acyltransferase